MQFDRDEVSDKSSGLTILLCLFFGSLGAHRFYVGKYKTGFMYLAVGLFPICMFVATRLFGVNGMLFSVIVSVCIFAFQLYDAYAVYSEIFLDANKKVILSGSRKDELFGRTYEEKLIDRLNIIALLLFWLALVIILLVYYYIVLSYTVAFISQIIK